MFWMRFGAAAAVACAVLSAGCQTVSVPAAPEPPRTRIQTLEEVTASLPSSYESRWALAAVDLQDKAVGVLEFGGDLAGAGAATNDTVSRLSDLQTAGKLRVTDRSRISQVETELRMSEQGYNDKSAAERAQLVGKQVTADYFLIGHVGEYKSERMTVPFKTVFKDGELERYEKDYAQFMKELDGAEAAAAHNTDVERWTVGSGTQGTSDLMMIRQLRQTTKKPRDYEEDIMTRQRNELVQVSKVGIGARLVDVRTSQPVWTFAAEANSIQLTDSMRQLVRRMLDDMTRGR